MKKYASYFLILSCYLQFHWVQASELDRAREFLASGEHKSALAELKKIPIEDQDPKRMALIETFRGLVYYEQKDFPKAIQSFQQALRLGTRLSDMCHYYIGKAQAATGQWQKAIDSLSQVASTETSDYLKWQAEYEIAKMQMQNKQWAQAERSFNRIKSKMRGTEIYPEILWSLLNIELAQARPGSACVWARDLYRNFPTYTAVKDWGLIWAENRVGNKALPCADSFADQQDRIKRLQWLGESEKADRELQSFEKSSVDQFTKHMARAEYLVNEGHVKKAFELLLPYYKNKQKRLDYEYINMLTKAGTRAGEYQASIGILLEAARTLNGADQKSALFKAAFASYQFRDYDSAIRLFEQLARKHPYSSYTKQANWYIPWLYYLKGNYTKSLSLMEDLSRLGGSRLPSSVTRTKLKYWMAMALKRMGKAEESQKIFTEVAHDQEMGYYSIAAIQRLKGMVGNRGLASIRSNRASGLTENWLPHLTEEETPVEVESLQTPVAKTKETYFSEWDTLPFMREYLDLTKPTQIFAKVSTPEFRSRIERSKDLSLLGLNELAKWELYSVEGRTKDQEHLKTLMFEYHLNQVYHRAVYIGTRHFAGTRAHLGLHLGASLWHFVLPRAYEKEVLESSQRFGVPAEFVWSIMKAETNFRADAVSPVGARGLMQVMTHTGRKVASLIGKEIEGPDLFKPEVAVEIGTSYLKRNLKKFKNKIPLAAAAYNGGPHRVQNWLHYFGDLDMDEFVEHIPFQETRDYVKKVTRYYTLYHLLYNKNVHAAQWLAQSVDVQIPGEPPTRETWEML